MADRNHKRRVHDAMIERMTRQINEIGSGRRQPDRPVSTPDGPFSRVRMVPDDVRVPNRPEPCVVAATVDSLRPGA